MEGTLGAVLVDRFVPYAERQAGVHWRLPFQFVAQVHGARTLAVVGAAEVVGRDPVPLREVHA
ncbi:hypothetical protein LP419_07915 [Massilia sp. H-1]|nr:hypothetical protein LP419_07915 [Massilia sp. H-1]